MTLNNSSVLSPKLRYNVGDEGLTHDARGRRSTTRRRSASSTTGRRCRRAGRRRSSSSSAGATARSPTWARTSIRSTSSTASTATRSVAAAIESFCLELEESPALESRPVVHVQLREGARLEREAAAERLRLGPRRLPAPRASRDFAEALREDPAVGRHRARAPRPRHRAVRRHGREDQERLRHPPIVKTTDLSKVPPYGRANAVFVGATRVLRGPAAARALAEVDPPPPPAEARARLLRALRLLQVPVHVRAGRPVRGDGPAAPLRAEQAAPRADGLDRRGRRTGTRRPGSSASTTPGPTRPTRTDSGAPMVRRGTTSASPLSSNGDRRAVRPPAEGSA